MAERERPRGVKVDNMYIPVLGNSQEKSGLDSTEYALGKVGINSCINGSSKRDRDATKVQVFNQCST